MCPAPAERSKRGARPRVVVARRIPRAGLELLERRFTVASGDLQVDREELLRRVRGAAALVADPTVPVDAALLDAAGPSLRVVANFAVGYDNVDIEACAARGIVVTNTPDVLTNATAELTVALMLAAARRLGEAERTVRAGRWTGWDPQEFLGTELAGSTIGIVGLGRIGTRVAELLRGFGAGIVYASRERRPRQEAELGVNRVTLEELLSGSDVVTLHVSLTSETRHMIDRETLGRFKEGSVLVNASRGGLVDTEALVDALREGPLGAAALDVYEDEPEIPEGLLELENVVLAPHIGSATAEARDAMARLAADNVVAVFEGRPPLTPVTAGG